ncbi:MAG: peptide ABC transporter substrate-binding protein [Rhodospirillaceae bacterium]|nr:peptide ABC transporter substrate-binding protein [Rhodospirillaceae bacterium]OUU15045.1 MAG: peptide ABC transporter substrate-binding protein [Candidatus Endolissoclinum sp. TMED37]
MKYQNTFLMFAPVFLMFFSISGNIFAYSEAPSLAKKVAAGKLPPVDERLPINPRKLNFKNLGLKIGKYGGSIRMLMARAKDARQMSVYGYSRLVGYHPKTFELEADILESFEVKEGRTFTFELRRGHRWSDGQPLTSEDFRYWWEDVANNKELSPVGPPKIMTINGELPIFEVINRYKFRYTWKRPNPDFLPRLASASPLYIYRPAHYMRQFHEKYTDQDILKKTVKKSKQRNWAALHNKMDNLYRNDNVDLPVLQPWVSISKPSASRLIFKRNPFFHRVDPEGKQLPYADSFIFTIANNKLIPAKTGTGEVDLQARYLRFDDYTFLKKGEERSPYSTRLWKTAKGAHLALFPNLNVNNPILRNLIRDVRFRRALSLGVHRHEINQVIYYGLAIGGNNSVLPESPLYQPTYRNKWANFDLQKANQLLDEIGLVQRDSSGIRLMPDGSPLHLIIETAGESTEQTDVLELVRDSWLKIGIKVFSKPSQRNVFRNRIFSGETAMSIWSGVENGLITANSSPAEFIPTSQQSLQWPKWGQYYETNGKAGERPTEEHIIHLLELYQQWKNTAAQKEKSEIWEKILKIHSDQIYSIGLVAAVLQPVVVSSRLKNVPLSAIYNWNPGAHFGIYKPDTFWFAAAGEERK